MSYLHIVISIYDIVQLRTVPTNTEVFLCGL